MLRSAGVRRRVLFVGDAAQVAHLRASLGASRSGILYGSWAVCSRAPSSRATLRENELDELIVADDGLRRGGSARDRRRRPPPGRPRPHRAADDAAPRRPRRVRARPGRAALRRPAADPRRRRLGAQADRSTSSSSALVVVLGLPVWLLIAAADQARLARPGPLRRRARRSRRATLPDAQVPHDGAGRRAASRRRSRAPTRRAARCSRSANDPRVTRVGRVLRRFSIDEVPNVDQRPPRPDVARRPAPAAAPRLLPARAVAPPPLERASRA